jgi:type I site-specific restriction endonuclease
VPLPGRQRIPTQLPRGRIHHKTTYAPPARDERRPGLYRDFPPDFFDLVIVDECHRGSARDIPTCKNVVLARVINSMTDFKQIIGRGTRVRDDYGKYYFHSLDYKYPRSRLSPSAGL